MGAALRLGVLVASLASTLAGAARAAPPRPSHLSGKALAEYGMTSRGFTFECWIRVDSKPGFNPRVMRCIRGQDVGCGNPGVESWDLGIWSRSDCPPGTLVLDVSAPDTCFSLNSPAIRVDDGAYHHVALRYDGIRLFMFVDAAEANIAVAGLNQDLAGGRLFLGTNGSDVSFDGQFDEMRIWRIARSASEIRRDMERPLETLPAEIVGYWPFDGDLRDRSPHANHLVASGHVLFRRGKVGMAVDILNVDMMHGRSTGGGAYDSTPIAAGDETGPIEGVAAAAFGPAAVEHGPARAPD